MIYLYCKSVISLVTTLTEGLMSSRCCHSWKAWPSVGGLMPCPAICRSAKFARNSEGKHALSSLRVPPVTRQWSYGVIFFFYLWRETLTSARARTTYGLRWNVDTSTRYLWRRHMISLHFCVPPTTRRECICDCFKSKCIHHLGCLTALSFRLQVNLA